MCGISAIYDLNMEKFFLLKNIKSMVNIQNHRGPDHNDQFVQEGIALGHNRLSIQDLTEKGSQPMFSEDKSVVIVFNGEIYNYKAMRKALQTDGIHFKSGTDTEVIIYLYLKYGYECLDMLNGAFSFAIYDFKKGELFCARDRVGEKPFVYSEYKTGFACASEIPALKTIPEIDLTYNETAIGIYLLRNIRHIPAPYTIFNGIKKLQAGHAMIVKEGKIKRIWKYWNPDWKEQAVSVGEVRTLLDESIKSRLVADVPVGAMLSGGVDSSAIAYGMVKNEGADVNTYALGLNQDDEELIRARKMSLLLGTNHKEFYFNQESQYQHLKKILAIYGEPIMLLPLLHAYEICEHIKEDGIKVVLNGNGADELFYGYDGDNNLALVTTIINTIPNHIIQMALELTSKIYDNKNIKNALAILKNKPGYRKAALYNNDAINLIQPMLKTDNVEKTVIEPLTNLFLNIFNPNVPKNYIDEANVIGLLVENEHSITISADLSSMAVGIESRAPFLNHNLIELAWKTNYKKKIPSIWDKTQNKWILKEALKGRIPEKVLYAKKQGFGYNINEENVVKNMWKKEVDAAFKNSDSFQNILEMDYVRKIKTNFDNGNENVSAMLIAKLFALFQFEQIT